MAKGDLLLFLNDDMEIIQGDWLVKLAEKAYASQLPKLYMACGEQDALYAANVRLVNKLTALGTDIRFEHWDGIHDWAFWDTAIRKALNHLL